MTDEPAIPEFTLPEWGTDGAPPPPPMPPDPPGDIEIEVERPVLVVAGRLPTGWDIHTVHGLVSAHGTSDKDGADEATAAATAKATAELRHQAAALGANAVTDVGLTTSHRKSRTVVTAWGTAVSFSRRTT